MTVTKEDVLSRVVDIKNLFLLGKWYAEVLEWANSHGRKGDKLNIEFEVRSIITDTFIFGYVCLPPKWTTFPEDWLNSKFKEFDKLLPTLFEAYGFEYNDKLSDEQKSWIPVIKRYFECFIEMSTSDDWHNYSKFKNNKISKKQEKKLLNDYLQLLDSYEKEKIPLWDACKEIRLAILAMLN